ncbi:hypothetical protein YC2023_091086 [Brassica napus]
MFGWIGQEHDTLGENKYNSYVCRVDEEDSMIISAHAIHGNKWAVIASTGPDIKLGKMVL